MPNEDSKLSPVPPAPFGMIPPGSEGLYEAVYRRVQLGYPNETIRPEYAASLTNVFVAAMNVGGATSMDGTPVMGYDRFPTPDQINQLPLNTFAGMVNHANQKMSRGESPISIDIINEQQQGSENVKVDL